MNISRKSWHYRYLNWLEAPIPHDLCNYFWLVVAMVLMAPIIAPTFFVFGYYEKRSPSKPGLFRLWWRAKKQRVCPL